MFIRLFAPLTCLLVAGTLAADDAGKIVYTTEGEKNVDGITYVRGPTVGNVFEITSRKGIGSLTLVRKEGTWPRPLLLSFPGLKNMESVKIGHKGAKFEGNLKTGTHYFDKAGKAVAEPKDAAYSMKVLEQKGGITVSLAISAEDAKDVDRWDIAWVNEFRR